MRFISRYAKYQITAVHEQRERLTDGTYKTTAPGFMCEFRHGDLTDAERELARKVFLWKGLPTSMGGQPLDPINDLHRVSAFDSREAPEHLRGQVEQALLSNAALGHDYVLVEEVKAEAPWPAYPRLVAGGRGRSNEWVVEQIVATVTATGVDVDKVLAYERENMNRPEVLDAVEALREPDEVQDELVTA